MVITSVDIAKASDILKLLGDKTRLSMVKTLDSEDVCVCEFVALYEMSQPAVSQHLRKLKDFGLVNEKKRGQWKIFSLNKESEYYPFVQSLLAHLPSQEDRLAELAQKGLRISCE
ncbi:ArsR family transcriptional regulator [Bacillus ectoiniformans]|uniref:ArsR/SmtB family transcription factor n=1 Tax=Bacillus ectoiniformans TaxID=1494429 RepID=UPI00195E49E4|nr:metalloregulator ArsR/SmtB family transcription factor [Bacillus ectoiniformans]MBM7647393.1 ArsR family transcriptional regulator [Bacillus ectoiniformans]